MTLVQKFVLGLAGLASLGVGAFILAAPHAFYASYGIALGPDPSLVVDGMPSSGVLGALVLELAIAALCLLAFRRGAGPAVSGLAAR